jgi:hypothetical protein
MRIYVRTQLMRGDMIRSCSTQNAWICLSYWYITSPFVTGHIDLSFKQWFVFKCNIHMHSMSWLILGTSKLIVEYCQRQFTWRSDFGLARYGLVYATGRQCRYSPVKVTFHCYKWTLLILLVQRRNVILNGSIERRMRKACYTNLPPSGRPPFCKTPR